MANQIRAPAIAEGWALYERGTKRVTWYCYCPYCGSIHGVELGKGIEFVHWLVDAACGLGQFQIKPIDHPSWEPWEIVVPEWEKFEAV